MKRRETATSGANDLGNTLVSVSEPRSIGRGYRDYQRFSVVLHDHGGPERRFERDVIRCGPVVGVIAVDPERKEVVLTRQFRLGAWLADGQEATIEIVAGRIDHGEEAEGAAWRECREEIGVDPSRLIPVLELSPAPAWSDERMTLFLARVDASQAGPKGGALHEQEEISVIRYKIDDAVELIAQKAVHSAPTVIALQWLKLNQDSILTLLNPPATGNAS